MAMMVAVEVVIEIVVVKMEGVLVGVVEEMGVVVMEMVEEETCNSTVEGETF